MNLLGCMNRSSVEIIKNEEIVEYLDGGKIPFVIHRVIWNVVV